MSNRPAVVMLLIVFFGGYPHPFYRVWNQFQIMPVPTVARGACRPWVSQIFRLLFLGNGWTDCVEILYAIGVPLFTYAIVFIIICLIGMHYAIIPLCYARAHVQRYPHTALQYPRNGLADCVQLGMLVGGH